MLEDRNEFNDSEESMQEGAPCVEDQLEWESKLESVFNQENSAPATSEIDLDQGESVLPDADIGLEYRFSSSWPSVTGQWLGRRPYNAVCRIATQMGNGWSYGTGVLFRPNVVVTCAHNMIDYHTRSRTQRLVVEFGLGPSTSPSERIDGSGYRVSERYESGSDLPEFDYGVIFLSRSTSIRPLIFKPPKDSDWNEIAGDIELPGYPILHGIPREMRFDRNRLGNVLRSNQDGQSFRIVHRLNAVPGSSGGPMIARFPVGGGERAPAVIGVHNKEGQVGGVRNNFGALLGKRMTDDLIRWTS